MTEISEVYNKYFTDVYRYTLSLCQNEAMAEEITQETFFKALKNIDKFKGDCKIRVWLCQIAKNTYLSLSRKKSIITYSLFEQEKSECIEEKLANKETAWEIHKSLHTLNEPYKEVFSLRVFGELSFFQISQLFGKTESWSRVTYHRAKIKLKESINENIM